MLSENITYVATVLGIQEAADNFPRKHGGAGTVYCHNLELLIEATGDTEQCQMCTDFAQVKEFEANDIIKVRAGKFTKGVTSVKFVEKMPRVQRTPLRPAFQPAPPPLHQDELPFRNPVVNGTAMDRALYNACHLYQMQGNVDLDKVEAAAVRFYNLLIQYNPQ